MLRSTGLLAQFGPLPLALAGPPFPPPSPPLRPSPLPLRAWGLVPLAPLPLAWVLLGAHPLLVVFCSQGSLCQLLVGVRSVKLIRLCHVLLLILLFLLTSSRSSSSS